MWQSQHFCKVFLWTYDQGGLQTPKTQYPFSSQRTLGPLSCFPNTVSGSFLSSICSFSQLESRRYCRSNHWNMRYSPFLVPRMVAKTPFFVFWIVVMVKCNVCSDVRQTQQPGRSDIYRQPILSYALDIFSWRAAWFGFGSKPNATDRARGPFCSPT